MKTLFHLLVIAAVASALFALKQRGEINGIRGELAQVQASTDAQPAGQQPAPAAHLPARAAVTPAAVAELRAQTRDIHKLRGEIPNAREQRRAIEQMQADNAQLREKIARIKANPEHAAGLAFPLSNKGLATPEAAIETAFWSMYHADVHQLAKVMPMAVTEIERIPPAERTNHFALLRAMAAVIEKLEVRELSYPSSEEAHVTVEITPRADLEIELPFREQKFLLLRNSETWQIVGQR